MGAQADAVCGAPYGASDALLEAIEAASSEHGGGWIEYGLVERSYALAHVDDWQACSAGTATRGTGPPAPCAQTSRTPRACALAALSAPFGASSG